MSRRNVRFLPVVAVSVATLATSAANVRPARAETVAIPFTTTTLTNGMKVILHEDHTVPIAVVNVSYKVGSRMEAAKRSGFAHLFEHLMFMGTQRAGTKMFDAWMENAGGWNNAWTSEDRTDYYDVAPPTALPLLLWLEADRLRDLGTFMTKDKLDTQRKVVQNERRQRSEDEPYGKVELRLPELLYPDAHPYHHPVIGSHEDLEAASVDDVKEFFATWYDPANASLVVAGDFDAKATLPKIRALFEGIPSRGAPKDPGAPGFDPEVSSLKTVARETIEDNVELAKVVIAWQSPKRFGAGDAELDLLGTVLASGKASRLYGSLVYTKKLAQDVDVRQESGTLGSRFVVDVTARPGVPLEKIEAAVDQELDMLRKADVKDEELQRAKNGVEAAFVHKLETVRERASLLNLYEADLGDPGFVGKDLARYAKVDAKSIRDAVTRWLDPKTRVILRVVPKKEGADTATKNGKGAAK